jgi:hypothetical protein
MAKDGETHEAYTKRRKAETIAKLEKEETYYAELLDMTPITHVYRRRWLLDRMEEAEVGAHNLRNAGA